MPAGGDDAHGVQPAGDVEAPELRGLAHVELVVVGEALRAAEEAAPADLPQQGHALHGVGEDGHELLFHMAGELVEAEVLGDRVEADRARDRLESAHEQAAGVLAVVRALVLVAQHRQVGRQGPGASRYARSSARRGAAGWSPRPCVPDGATTGPPRIPRTRRRRTRARRRRLPSPPPPPCRSRCGCR